MACGGEEADGGLRAVLIQNKKLFEDNLEVNRTLPLLLEKSIISQEKYEQINSIRSRSSQRKRLFDILISKNGNHRIQPFIQILNDTEQIYLISDTATHLADLDGIPKIPLGQTCIVLPEHDEIVIRFNVRMTDQVDEARMLHALSTDQAVIDEAIANEVLDIREGNSICIHMRQVNADTSRGILEAIHKRLNAVFVWTKLPANVVIDIEVYRKPKNMFFDKYFVKPKTILDSGSSATNICQRCLRTTILCHEEELLDQMETDIMEETFQSSENASEFIKNVCLFVPRPRVYRAKMFMIYLMQNGNVLQNFYVVCKKNNVWDFDMVSCKDCNINGNSSLKSTEKPKTERKPFLTFTIIDGNVSNVHHDEQIKKTEDLEIRNTLLFEEKEHEQSAIPAKLKQVLEPTQNNK